MIQLTQLASDNFNRANENPLSQGGNWSVNQSGDTLQVVSDACEVGTLSASCVETYTGQTLPNNQYASVTIKSLTAANFPQIQLYARSNGGVLFSTLTAYELLLSTTASALFLYAWVSGTRTAVISSFPITVSAGDVWTLAPDGTTVYIFKNGTQLTSGIDSTVTSGYGGLGAASFTTDADVVFSNFSVGSVSSGGNTHGWSPVDSRVNPNQGVIQPSGAVFYTGQTSDNPAIPPTDSRVVAPVDSRTTGSPLNSRVDPDLPL